MKKITVIAWILVFALQLMPPAVSAEEAPASASAPTMLWLEPSEANGIPVRIDAFKARTGGTSAEPEYTYQVYLPGDADPAACFLSWDGGATATADDTAYESGACPLPQPGEEKTYAFSTGAQEPVSLRVAVYQGSPNVQRVFIQIDETYTEEGETQPHTIAAMDGDPDHEQYCTGLIYINGEPYELTRMKGRGNATWENTSDKKPYNITLGSKINFPGVDSEKTKKWTLLAEAMDRTLLGNRTGFRLAHQIGAGQDTASADVWMNGEYQGCYTVTPKADSFVAKTGFMIEQDNYLEGVENGGDPQFILEGMTEAYGWPSCHNRITVKKIGDELLKNSEGIVDESPENLDDVAQNVIKPWLQDAWDAIRSDTGYNAKGKYYTDYIDIESFARMYLIHEYIKSYDVCAGSLLFYRSGTGDGDKLYAGPLWDADNAMGSVCRNDHLGPADDRINGDRRSAEGSFIPNITEYKTSVYKTISRHADFMAEVSRQYNKYREVFQNAETAAQALIDEISASAMMNHRKVLDLGNDVYHNYHYYEADTTFGSGQYSHTYYAAGDAKTDWPQYAANLKTFIRTRSLWFWNTYYDENYCGHDYEAAVTPPTCTEEGYTTYTCVLCGDSYTADPTPVIPHDYREGRCAVCGQRLISVRIVCPGGASVTVYETQDPAGPCAPDAVLAYPRNGETGFIDCGGDGQVNFAVVLLPGYTLAGVSAGPAGTYKNLKDLGGNAYRLTKITGDLTITVRVYGTVTFAPNGGSGTMEPLSVILGEETALTPCAFTRQGYAFTGWNTAADGSGTAYADRAAAAPAADLTLYAQWVQPSDPPVLTAVSAGGAVTVSWNAVPGATKYALYRREYTDAWSAWTTVDNALAGTSYADAAVIPGRSYQYRMKAFNGAWSTYSRNAGATVEHPKPDAPAVTAFSASGAVTVCWTEVNGAAQYALERREYTDSWSGWSPVSTGLTGTSYGDTDVTVGRTYQYRARAWNGTWSDYSAPAEVKAESKPAAPEMTASYASGRVAVKWDPVDGAIKYTVYRRAYSGSWSSWEPVKTNLTGTSWSDAAITPGTEYQYRMRAYNGTWSDYCAAVNVKTAVPKPAAPTFTVSYEDGAMYVAWTAVSGAKKYALYRSCYKNGAWTGWTIVNTQLTGTSVMDPGVEEGYRYQYRMKAYNGVWSDYTPVVNVYSVSVPPAAPVISASAESGQITVTWGSVPGAVKYAVYRAAYENGKWGKWTALSTVVKGAETSYEDKTARAGVKYQYRMKAFNGLWSVYSNTVTIIGK